MIEELQNVLTGGDQGAFSTDTISIQVRDKRPGRREKESGIRLLNLGIYLGIHVMHWVVKPRSIWVMMSEDALGFFSFSWYILSQRAGGLISKILGICPETRPGFY